MLWNQTPTEKSKPRFLEKRKKKSTEYKSVYRVEVVDILVDGFIDGDFRL